MKLRALVFCCLLPSLALADALPPPSAPAAQIAAAPNHRPLILNSADGSSFRYTGGDTAYVTRPSGHYGTVSPGSGGTLTGNKTHPVRLTNNYGQTATGQIRTATTISPATSRAGAALLGASIVGSAANHQSQSIGSALSDGRYGDAVQASILGLLQAADITGLGQGYINIRNAMSQAQQAKAQSAVGAYQDALQSPSDVSNDDHRKYYVAYGRHANQAYEYRYLVLAKDYPAQDSSDIALCSDWRAYPQSFAALKSAVDARVVGGVPLVQAGPNYCQGIGPAQPNDLKTLQYRAAAVEITAADLFLSQQEIADLLIAQMAANDANATAIINAIYAAGGINPTNSQTTVTGTPAENTFLTAPFTAAGSDTAQQTQFVFNADGSVTVSQIQRPDLAAHTSQAPTRAEVGQTVPSQSETRDVKQGSTAEKPDVCAQNPNSLMCTPVGSTDYQDFVLPQQQINIALNPMAVFSTDAQCPAPTNFSLVGTQQTMSYDTVCSTARKARPFIIMLGMFVAFMMVYGALARK